VKAVEVEHLRTCGRDEWRMRSRGHVRHFLEPLDVLRAAAELEVANEHAIRTTAERPVLFLVNLLELDALVEFHRAFEVLLNLVFGGVQQTKLQHGPCFRTAHEVVKSAPRSFEFAERFVVHDFVEIFVHFLIEFGDARLIDPTRSTSVTKRDLVVLDSVDQLRERVDRPVRPGDRGRVFAQVVVKQLTFLLQFSLGGGVLISSYLLQPSLGTSGGLGALSGSVGGFSNCL
jgi:hypothetical protein